MNGLKDIFELIFSKYLSAKQGPFKDGSVITQSLRVNLPPILDLLPINTSKYTISYSIGKGNWATIPWIAIFDEDISASARKGYYIVYLFSADMKKVYLSLNQGWTYYEDRFKTKLGREKIQQVSEICQKKLKPSFYDFSTGPISLESNTRNSNLPEGYQLGHICGKCYYASDLPAEDLLKKDLIEMLSLFRELKKSIVNTSYEASINTILSEDSNIKENLLQTALNTDIEKIIVDEGQGTNLILMNELPSPVRSITKSSGTKKCRVKLDYHENSRKQDQIGKCGEYMVLTYEQERVKAYGFNKQVEHVSVTTNDSAGYDIKSYDEHGNEIHIEVKTTLQGLEQPFFITAAEVNHSQKYPDKYRLYRVHSVDPSNGTGELYILPGDISEKMHLTPQKYIVKGLKGEGNE